MKRPFLKFYPADWRADPKLHQCSLAARGLWIELMGFMHEGDPYGTIPEPDLKALSRLVGASVPEVKVALKELSFRGVFDFKDGRYISRRMVRDYAKALADQENGRKGGNPGVNPPLKAHIPEARYQTPESKTPIGARTNTGGAPAVGASHEDILKDEKSTNVIVGNFDMVSPDGKFFITSTEIEALEAEFPTVKGIRDRVRNALRSWTVDIQPGRRKAAIHKHLINEMQKIAERHETRAAREAARVREKAVADARPKTHFQQMRELGFKAW